MKRMVQNTNMLKNAILGITCMASLLIIPGCKKGHDLPSLTITTLTTGLENPMGLETDKYGNVWVAESGDGHNNGKVLVITKDGVKHDAILNIESIITEGGEVEGPSDLLFTDGLLYITGAHGKLYKVNLSGFKPGDVALEGSTLAFEDVGSFVLSYPFTNNTHQTHTYGISKGPDGSIYIADAAANAIIHREHPGVFSVLAEVPGIPNPTPVGPPVIESVPTGIIYDGHDFLVSTLLGFPFPQGLSVVYKISKSGIVSVYQPGLTSLVDIAEGNYYGHLVLQHAVFGPMGFAPNTGKLVWVDGTSATDLTAGLNLPVGLKQANGHTWYVSSLGDGSVLKVTYQ